MYHRSVRQRPASFLVIDDEPAVRQALVDALTAPRRRIIQAASISEAKRMLQDTDIDVMLIDVHLPDGNGIDLAEQLAHDEDGVQSIVITGDASLPSAVAAIRAGVCDFLAKPLKLDELNACVGRALQRRADNSRLAHRLTRLRQLCKKLHKSRNQVTQQVDVLCNDLVSAYQELAEQMKYVQMATEFKTAIEQELELEELLRTALQYILKHSGAANVLLFLPAPGGGHSVGGYVNYSFERADLEITLDRLNAIVAPRIAETEQPMMFNDDAQAAAWLGEDCPFIEGSQVIVVPCRHNDEALASLLLMRDRSEPFSDELPAILTAIAPMLGGQLLKLIKVHHRLKGLEDDGDLV